MANEKKLEKLSALQGKKKETPAPPPAKVETPAPPKVEKKPDPKPAPKAKEKPAPKVKAADQENNNAQPERAADGLFPGKWKANRGS